MPCKITPSDLAGLIAVQLGDMEADIEGRLQDEVSRMQFSFSNRCPDPNALAKIVNLKNQYGNNHYYNKKSGDRCRRTFKRKIRS